MARKRETKHSRKKEKNSSGLFIPAGLLLGIGVGFLIDKLVASMFIGLGLGFLAFAISRLIIKNQ